MKVTAGSNAEPNLNKKVDKTSSANNADAGDDANVDASGEKLDFASVLDRVTKSREHEHTRSEEHHEGTSTKASTKKAAGNDDETESNVGGATAVRSEALSPGHIEVPYEPTSLLHPADLEKIIAAARVQVAPGGQTEVLLDLSRSLLEGLRVKVRTDGAGRVATEFLAANEGVKSLLDSRSAELISLLRSRGINLTEFKTSVATDANSGGNNPQQQSRQQVASAASVSRTDGAAADDAGSSPDGADETASGATYRA
jgi:hypothetical protein